MSNIPSRMDRKAQKIFSFGRVDFGSFDKNLSDVRLLKGEPPTGAT